MLMAKKFRGIGGRSYGSSKKGKGMPGNLNQMLKQAQEAQKQMEELEETFKNIEISTTAGGGALKITATCDRKIKSIEIDEDLKDEDIEILSDLLVAGVNEILENIEKRREEESSSLTQGMNLPENLL